MWNFLNCLVFLYLLLENVETKELKNNQETMLTDYDDRILSKRYSVYGGPWLNKVISWNFMNSKYPKTLQDTTQIRKTLKKAFAIWQEGSVLKFKEVNDSRADIIIKFEKGAHEDCPGYSFTGRGGLLAHAWPPGRGINGDIHFDDDEPWDFYGNKSGPGSELKDFFSVAFHEIGHSLGLGHSPVPKAVMSANYIKLQRNLHMDDILGLQEMYGVKPKLSTVKKRTTVAPLKTTTSKINIPSSRIPHRNQTQTLTKPTNCNKSYDVIAMIQDEVVMIKGRLVWRLNNGILITGYPKEIDNVWHNLPKRITHIDAVFENKKQNKVWIFVGQRIFIYDGFELKFVKMLKHLGLPANLKKIDSIFTLGDKRTYILSAKYYWKMAKNLKMVESETPRKSEKLWIKGY